jgi:hypothetical protein
VTAWAATVDGLTISEEGKVCASHDGNGNVELEASEAVKLLHLDKRGALVRRRWEEVMGKLVSRAQDVASRVDKMQ